VDVEDPLRNALVGVLGRDDERENERETDRRGGNPGQALQAAK
jgi:hypothetical protein